MNLSNNVHDSYTKWGNDMATEREIFFNEMKGEGDGIVRATAGCRNPTWIKDRARLDVLNSVSEYVSFGISDDPGDPPNHEWTDPWGCRWIYPIPTLDGICNLHPLADWSALADYRPPDPEDHVDWKKIEKEFVKTKENGSVASGNTDHGGFFLRMTYLRGFENFMMDVVDEPPELERLIEIIEGYWFEVVRRWVEIGAENIWFGDDLGLQVALPMSPASWRKFIGPSYERIYDYCRKHDVHVSMHSDGYVVDIIPDLVNMGVTTLNVQDLVNGLDTLERLAKGRTLINLDIDRQNITVYGTPEEVDEHILNCVRTLGSPKGGLTFIWGIYSPTPIENIEAAVHAMAKYSTYWVGRDA